MERKEALKKIASAVVAVAATSAIPLVSAASESTLLPKAPTIKLPDPSPNEDILITMQRDLIKALNKPLEQRKWSMTIDLRKCIGCHACTVGCIVENKLPPGVVYRPVREEETGTPHIAIKFLPRPCMQCENPPCTTVCPVSATWRREDGITVIDYETCIGCRYCIVACPYGARSIDSGQTYTEDTPHPQDYEKLPAYEYGRKWVKEGHFSSPTGNARKCHFCIHRLEEGMLPMCVSTCVGRATYFGDMSDKTALITKVTAHNNTWKFKEGMGTKPSVTYLI